MKTNGIKLILLIHYKSCFLTKKRKKRRRKYITIISVVQNSIKTNKNIHIYTFFH